MPPRRDLPPAPGGAWCADDGVTQQADAAGAPLAQDEGAPQQAQATAASDGVPRYGALAGAAGAGGATGFSVWFPSQSAADQRALTECAQAGGENCEIRERFAHRCAAVAYTEEPYRSWGFGASDSKAGAIDTALAKCRANEQGECVLEDWACGQVTN